jgi:hypothetical protein
MEYFKFQVFFFLNLVVKPVCIVALGEFILTLFLDLVEPFLLVLILFFIIFFGLLN